MGMNFDKIVATNGKAVLLLVMFVVLLGKLANVSGIGTDAQTTATAGITTLDDILDYIIIAIIIGVFVYFFKQMGGKSGFGA